MRALVLSARISLHVTPWAFSFVTKLGMKVMICIRNEQELEMG